jgi:hypothetical protein
VRRRAGRYLTNISEERITSSFKVDEYAKLAKGKKKTGTLTILSWRLSYYISPKRGWTYTILLSVILQSSLLNDADTEYLGYSWSLS